MINGVVFTDRFTFVNEFFQNAYRAFADKKSLIDIMVNRESTKNSRDIIKIYALTDGCNIVLDRKALALKRFNFAANKEFGKNEFRAILATLNTISHELAHMLYRTEDNTVEHYIKQEQIYQELERLYNNF